MSSREVYRFVLNRFMFLWRFHFWFFFASWHRKMCCQIWQPFIRLKSIGLLWQKLTSVNFIDMLIFESIHNVLWFLPSQMLPSNLFFIAGFFSGGRGGMSTGLRLTILMDRVVTWQNRNLCFLNFFQKHYITRKSSCVNARGIPPAV